MKIAIDISPLEKSSLLAHRVRGTGFYIDNLKKSLLKYFPQNKYIFFTRGENLPKDINLVHYTYFEPFFLSLPVIKAQKTVVTVHDLTPLVFKKFFPAGIKGNFKWQIQKLGLKTANAVITDSESSKKDIIKYTGLPSSRVNVVYLAAGEEFKRIKNIKNKYNLPEKFVLYVGDVTWNKNLPRLIEAVKKINVSFVMIGSAIMQKNFDRSNPWNQDLSKILKLTEDDKKIIKLGFVSQEDLVAIYNLSTVFAMPSLYEGFGLPIQEIAGEAAYYVNAYDVDDIANGIGELFFSQKLQQELSEKGLIQAKKFSWKKTAEETIGVYEQATL